MADEVPSIEEDEISEEDLKNSLINMLLKSAEEIYSKNLIKDSIDLTKTILSRYPDHFPTIKALLKYQPQLEWNDIHLFSRIFNEVDSKSLNSCVDVMELFLEPFPNSYDAAWLILEWWEQIGQRAWKNKDCRKIFIERYSKMCIESSNTLFKACLTWGLNEFLERGSQEAIGLEIARRLIKSNPGITVYRVLHILSILRPSLKKLVSQDDYQLPSPDSEILFLNSLATEGIRKIEGAPGILTNLSHAAKISPPQEIEELMSFLRTQKSDNGIGIVAMGELKRLLYSVMEKVEGNYERIKEICLSILKKVDSDADFSKFLGIESLEAVRDKAPTQCAQIMGEYLNDVKDKNLAFGINVCIAEGYEEGGEKSTGAKMRLIRDSGIWKAVEKHPDNPQNELDVYFPVAAKAINLRKDLTDVAFWLNKRLDQHPNVF